MNMSKRNRLVLLLALLLAVAAGLVWYAWTKPPVRPEPAPATTLRPVSFGMLPYGDHTYAIIGAKQGWFREVGIDLRYRAIKVEEIVPLLKNGSLDLVSTPPGILFAAHDNAPNLVSFVFGDIFQGYAVLARPDLNLRSQAEFVAEGMTPEQAVAAVVAQMRGKTLAYPSEAAIQPFIDLVLRKGSLRRSDIKPLVLDDPLTVNAMRRGQADLQVGGVPSRLVLEREGFKVLLSSIDLARMAKPSASSQELASILQNGWATTRQFYREHHDDVLRIASVNYRIMQAIKDQPDAALAIHMPYLSEVSGQKFTAADGQVIYSSLDPFKTFDEQREWFHESASPLYYAHVNGAILQTFVTQGVFKNKAPTVEDVILADDIYRELEQLRAEAAETLRAIEARGPKARQSPKYLEARHHFQIFNFLDAARLAREALKEL
jgi:ABC-type nitrate/sulfonate/bicarbonate transport system substrate-binding protein